MPVRCALLPPERAFAACFVADFMHKCGAGAFCVTQPLLPTKINGFACRALAKHDEQGRPKLARIAPTRPNAFLY